MLRHLADVSAIKGLATSVSLVAPYSGASGATVSYGGTTASPSISGVTAEYAIVRNWQVTRGRFIEANDESLATVVVLGSQVVEDLFGNTAVNPVGETIRINRQNYTVVGVLAEKGQSGPNNQDNVIFMLLRTARRHPGSIPGRGRRAERGRRADRRGTGHRRRAGDHPPAGAQRGARHSRQRAAGTGCVSLGIGIFFGLFPANRAGRLKPLEALRYE